MDLKTILRPPSAVETTSLGEFWSRMQVIRVVEPITVAAYREVERQTWIDQSDDAPHGNPWHVSFHGSQFPGNDRYACERQLLYRMMDFAPIEPFSRESRTVMAAGKAIEVELVRTWHKAGILLSEPPDAEVQTNFALPDVWLTGTADAIILPYRWNKPLPIEVKSKYDEEIELMLKGARGPDASHVRQVKVEIAFTRLYQKEMWPDLELADHGVIYYLSRDRPSKTAEYRVDYDEAFWKAGVEKLQRYKENFVNHQLPMASEKKHPNGTDWRWSQIPFPCRYCDFKKWICKPDWQEGITDLRESNGVKFTKSIREHYDPDEAMARVLKFWEDKVA